MIKIGKLSSNWIDKKHFTTENTERNKKMIIEEIRNIKSDKNECRKFGLSVGIVLIIIALILAYFDKASYVYFGTIGGILIIAGVAVPIFLLPLQKIWMSIAVILGFIMTRVILFVLYYLILTPIGLIARIFGKDFLDLNINKDQVSYWNIRDSKTYEKLDTERQF
jgi:uncharacterized membrane protein